MEISVKEQLRWWGIGFLILTLVLWQLGNVMLPYITGAAIAYFLDPLADRLERMGCSRVVATLLITLVALIGFVVIVLVLVPTFFHQLTGLVAEAPTYAKQLQAIVQERFPTLMEPDSILRQTLDSIVQTMRARSADLANTVITSAFSVIDMLIFLVVVPVVAFYLLLDWDRMVAVVDGWLPRDHADTIRMLGHEVNRTLAGFVHGQLSVSGILGAYYAIALMLVGLKFGLVVGIIAGLISFIPYVGAIVGGVLAIGLALFQFWGTPLWIGAVVAIFLVGQFVEGNILSPNLVGRSVGLHPVWLMFSLSVFGSLFGFAGLLTAVPLAATIGVFARFAVRQYLSGRLYLGSNRERDSTDRD